MAGRRLALERKISLNVQAHGRLTRLVTLTPPGQDVLPYGAEWAEIKGKRVQQVEWIYRTVFNVTAGRRASRLFEAAQVSADRWLRRQGYDGPMPRQVANAWGWQKRGLKHWHWLLPNQTPIEVAWTRQVVRFLDHAWRSEQARWGGDGRWDLLWAEFSGQRSPRGFYGFGYVDRKSNRVGETAARYLARNAAGYLAGQGGGHYVSRDLTRLTGVTMRALRACNWLYYRRAEILAGRASKLEGGTEWVPYAWSEAWRDHVLAVWSLCGAPQAP